MAEVFGEARHAPPGGFAKHGVAVGDTTFHCTVSAGLATLNFDTGSVDQAIKLADEALYTAKSTGRDRIVVHESCLPAPRPAPTARLRAAAG